MRIRMCQYTMCRSVLGRPCPDRMGGGGAPKVGGWAGVPPKAGYGCWARAFGGKLIDGLRVLGKGFW